MKLKHVVIMAGLTSVIMVASVLTIAGEATMVMPKADLKWKDMGNGIAAAAVSGNMDKGASRFFLKYPVGLVTPKHHNDADHHVTLVSGTITLNAARKDHKLGPGSFFSLTKKAMHTKGQFMNSHVAEIGDVLERHFKMVGILEIEETTELKKKTVVVGPNKKAGEICPKCQSPTLMRVEGCGVCTNCNYSACG